MMPKILLALALVVLSGCSLSNLPTPRATYRPVPDPALCARIAAIPGVTGVDLRWSNGFDNPNGYRGSIHIKAHTDAVQVLDRALAILRQGHPAADLGGLEVAPDGSFATSPLDVGLMTQADYTARYGPQPGTGIPPPTPLRLRR